MLHSYSTLGNLRPLTIGKDAVEFDIATILETSSAAKSASRLPLSFAEFTNWRYSASPSNRSDAGTYGSDSDTNGTDEP